jgi:hypothetical protein
MSSEAVVDFHQLDPKRVLRETAFEEYEKGIGFFFSELVTLNTIIYLAEKILAFRFDLFLSRDDQTFFSVVMSSFYDSAILTITRLATDEGADVFTLRRFKNRVLELVQDEYKKDFRSWLRRARFDKQVEELLTKARDLRHHRIGHTTNDFIAGRKRVVRPGISEIKELRNALNSLLDALAFNVEFSKLPIPYDSRVRPQRRTDIEEILDNIARDSAFLNMPEQRPDRWIYRRLRLNTEKLDTLNQYRRKFELPEA